MTSFVEYKEKKRQKEIENIDIIDNADYEAVEREEERIIREGLGLPHEDGKINYNLCRKHDKEEYDRFQKAADKLMDEVMEDPDSFFGEN